MVAAPFTVVVSWNKHRCYYDFMRRHQILLDDESERILESLAQPLEGNKSLAVPEALKMQRAVEGLLDQVEHFHSGALERQRERSEAGFRSGKFTRWKELKRRNRL